MLQCRLATNQMSLTLQQVVSKRRKLLLDMKDNIALEVRGELQRAPAVCVPTRLRLLSDAGCSRAASTN